MRRNRKLLFGNKFAFGPPDTGAVSSASALSMFAYNILGYAAAPFVCGLLAETFSLRWGFRTVLLSSAVAFIGLLSAWRIAERELEAKKLLRRRGRLAHTNPMRDSYASSREPENAGESNLEDIKTTALPGCEGLHPNADALNASCLVDEPRSLGDGEVRKARHAVGTSLRNSAAQLGRSLSLDQAAAVSALRVELAEPLTSKSSHVRSGL